MMGRLYPLVLVASCYRPPSTACLQCTTSCPAGYSCENGVCVAPGSEPCSPNPGPDATSGRCRTAVLDAIGDTYLDSPSENGTQDVLITYITRPIILNFDLALGADEHLESATIHLTPVTRANGCGGTCGSCPALAARQYQVYWNIADWAEEVANSHDKRTNVAWESDYATGPMDRSNLLASGPLGTAVDIDIPANRIAALPPTEWMVGSRLSVQLLLDDTAAFAASDQGCDAPRQGPQLTVTICR